MQLFTVNKWKKGFTLIELLVVIVIISILVGLGLKGANDLRRKAKETQVATNMEEIQKALEQFATDNNGMYPFRIRWFDDSTANSAGFDPYTATDTGTGMTSDPTDGWFSLGLIGGVPTVTDSFGDNTTNILGSRPNQSLSVIQPGGSGFDFNFYENFNQYSDPLVALGYLDSYPENPFMKRTMGNILWTYGNANWLDGGTSVLDKTIPGEDVVPTPGDFVYTHFYETDGTDITEPEGIVEAKVSYVAESPTDTHEGVYYLDLIDSFHMWGYHDLPLNGPRYVAYPNNSFGLSSKGLSEARKDQDNSGTKDLYEQGMIWYFNQSGGTAAPSGSDSGGNRVDF